MYFAYDLYKPVETRVQTVGRRVQTVQTMREENKARTSISFDLGLYGLYTFYQQFVHRFVQFVHADVRIPEDIPRGGSKTS